MSDTQRTAVITGATSDRGIGMTVAAAGTPAKAGPS